MKDIEKLLDVVRQLRDPVNGCPWDKEQTHNSLRRFVIEEAYEVAAAITDSPGTLSDELGDLLLQILLHAQIASESGTFSFQSIVNTLTEKLIRRHPHVFGSEKATTSEEVKTHWERVKREEKGNKQDSMLADLTIGLPALVTAYKIGTKVARVNFDWDTASEVLVKVKEELLELEEAMNSVEKNSLAKIEEELGDLIFTIAQLSRKFGLDPEVVALNANNKFIKRFRKMEQQGSLEGLSKEELEVLWLKAKE